MGFLEYKKDEVSKILSKINRDALFDLFLYVSELVDEKSTSNFKEISSNRNKVSKQSLDRFFLNVMNDAKFIASLNKKLTSTNESKFLYNRLVWDISVISLKEIPSNIKIKTPDIINRSFLLFGYDMTYKLIGALSLIDYVFEPSSNRQETSDGDFLKIDYNIVLLLRYALPLPSDYYLNGIKEIEKVDFIYDNEQGVFSFLSAMEDLIEGGFVELSKSGEKPLAKTLNLLRGKVADFYPDKGLENIATDMLIRVFYFYYQYKNKFHTDPLNTIVEVKKLQFEDKLEFSITRFFLSHLKGARFDRSYTSQEALFKSLAIIIGDMDSKEGWFDIENIMSFCKYRNFEPYVEKISKVLDCTMNCEINGKKGEFSIPVSEGIYHLYMRPIFCGSFFYLAALGIVKIGYNNPTSISSIRACGKPYMTIWDGIRYVQLTKLGRYLFNFSKNYTPKIEEKSDSFITLDEHKLVITVGKDDTIGVAKVEQFAEKIDTNMYHLSCAKVFKDCDTLESLKDKIASFYKKISATPPEIYKRFFEDILKKANLLKQNKNLIVLELKEDKALIDFIMQSKKVQELVIKAQGYKLIIAAEDVPRLTKVLMENGFFIKL